MKITRNNLEHRVERLNAVLNRPAAGWTRSTDAAGKVSTRANIGHFLLETNSPGDGWTRYTLAQIVSEGGGEINVSPCCDLQGMWDYLRGVFDVLDSQFMCDGEKHTFDKGKTANDREAKENPQAILQAQLDNLIDAAERVVERWSKGDLADAINGLRVDAENAKTSLAQIRSQSVSA